MKISDIFNILHNAVEAKYNGRKISQKEMATRYDIPMRTYQDWKIGNTKPKAAKIVIDMLNELDDEEIIRVVRRLNKIDT